MRNSGGAALTSKRPRKVLAVATVAILFAALIAVWNQPALLRIGTLISLLDENTPPKLPVPVEEVASRDLADTWGAPRSDNRRHEGIDIFAPRGRPVISTTNGVVFKVGEDNLGGHVVRVLGPGWQWHYFAHLDRFGDIEPGSIVQQGTVLGYVGNTGNASGTPYHLHYGVYRFLGGARNPYPMLAADRLDPKMKKTARRVVPTTRLSHSRRHAPAKSSLEKPRPQDSKQRTGRYSGRRSPKPIVSYRPPPVAHSATAQ
jgi:murein DD-endopeptidase MepM/ murein hydrolase activator NlpD